MRSHTAIALTFGICLVLTLLNPSREAISSEKLISASVKVASAIPRTQLAPTNSDTNEQVLHEPMGGPYRHVTPEDVGVSIGPGVIAPYPSKAYTGPTRIKSPTTIENVVIDGCLRIESDNVTVRNVVIKCDTFFPVKAAEHSNARIEYSLVICTIPTKVFRLIRYRNFVVHRTETRGCEDLFSLSGDNDGLEVTYNYMHSLTLTPKSHADGFQFGGPFTTGSGVIRGNYFWPNADGPKTDIVFAPDNTKVDLLIEDNFFYIWGLKTIRCGGTESKTSCIVRNNVYEQAFENMYLKGKGKLLFSFLTGYGNHIASCNRLADGTLLKEFQDGVDRFRGVKHIVSDCPPWPY